MPRSCCAATDPRPDFADDRRTSHLGQAVALLIVIAAIASCVPARHAARIEPLVALRQD
jgi:ABC-type lipoprotein release transport system permease subunit